MADIKRKTDGTPADWMPGGTSVQHPIALDASAHGIALAGQPGSGFDRTLVKPEDADKRLEGDAQYMPQPFLPTLPQLGDKPRLRIFRDPPITTIDDFSINDIKGALQGHAIGQFLSSARLADVMTADDRVASVLGTRVKGLLGLPFTVTPRGKYKDTDEAKHIKRHVKRDWDRMVPLSQVAEFLQWGVMMGFALAEIVWQYRAGMWIPTIRTWHPQLTYYRYDERAFYVITMDGPEKVVPGDGKWILYAPHGDYRGWMHGAVRTCAQPWRFRTFGMRDWARHSEKHGFPIIEAQVPLNSSEEDKREFYASLQNLGSEPVIGTPQVDQFNKFGIQMHEASHPAADVFEKLIMRCDTLISCAMLGQNLTTEVQGGSYAAATVHGQVRQDYLEADAMTLAQCLRQQLLRPYCAYNFEHGLRYVPEVAWNTTPPDNRELKARMVQEFGNAVVSLVQAGFPLDVEALALQFGVPIKAPHRAPKPKAVEGEETEEKNAITESDGDQHTAPIFSYHMQFGVVTINEVRAQLGLPPIDGGDVPPAMQSGGGGDSMRAAIKQTSGALASSTATAMSPQLEQAMRQLSIQLGEALRILQRMESKR